MNVSAHEARITALEMKANEQEKRLYALELKEAVSDEQYKTVIKRLDKIDSHVSKLVWLAVVSILGYVFKFILEGGLHNIVVK